jgi:hypothetical protein
MFKKILDFAVLRPKNAWLCDPFSPRGILSILFIVSNSLYFLFLLFVLFKSLYSPYSPYREREGGGGGIDEGGQQSVLRVCVSV